MGEKITLNETLVLNAALLAIGSTCIATGVGVTSFGIFAAPAVGVAGWGAKSFFDNWSTKSPYKKRALKNVQARLNETLRGSELFAHVDAVLLETINKELPTALTQAWPAPKVITQLATKKGGFRAAIPDHIIAGFRDNIFVIRELKDDAAEPYIRAVIVAALDAALADEKYFKTLEPYLLMETLGLTGDIKHAIEALVDLPENVRSLGDAIQIMNSKLDAMRETQLKNSAKIDEILRQVRGGHVPSPDAEPMLQKTIAEMLSSDREATKLAVADLMANPSDPGTATSRLKQAIAECADARREATEGELEMLKEIAAINYYINSEEAISAFKNIVKLVPNDARIWNQFGILNKRMGKLEQAVECYKKVERIGFEDHNLKLKAIALGNIGGIELIQDKINLAEANFYKSLKLYQLLDMKAGIANQTGNLALIARKHSDFKNAIALFKKSLSINLELNRQNELAIDYSNLGDIALIEKRMEDADQYYYKSIAVSKETDNIIGIARGHACLGNVSFTLENWSAAKNHFENALSLFLQLDHKVAIATMYGNLGSVERGLMNLTTARNYYEKAQTLNKELGSKEGLALQYANLGLLEKSLGNIKIARNNWEKALNLFSEVGAARHVQSVQNWLRQTDSS